MVLCYWGNLFSFSVESPSLKCRLNYLHYHVDQDMSLQKMNRMMGISLDVYSHGLFSDKFSFLWLCYMRSSSCRPCKKMKDLNLHAGSIIKYVLSLFLFPERFLWGDLNLTSVFQNQNIQHFSKVSQNSAWFKRNLY